MTSAGPVRAKLMAKELPVMMTAGPVRAKLKGQMQMAEESPVMVTRLAMTENRFLNGPHARVAQGIVRALGRSHTSSQIRSRIRSWNNTPCVAPLMKKNSYGAPMMRGTLRRTRLVGATTVAATVKLPMKIKRSKRSLTFFPIWPTAYPMEDGGGNGGKSGFR